MRHPTKHLRLFLTSLIAAGWLAVIAAPAAVMAGQHSTAGLARAIAAQEFYTNDLMAIPGVVGTAVGLGANGEAVVKIYTAAGGIAGLPGTLDGVGVRIEVTGRFFALHHKDGHDKGPGNGNGDEVDPTAKFDRPVPIGVSSGTLASVVVANGFVSCSTGTLGARLTDGANPVPNVYALSNNHVYALENGNEVDVAVIGASIVQPGPVDTDPVCTGNLPEDTIGTLTAYVEIEFSTTANNKVDAAIASTTTGDVGTGTPSDGYGEPKNAILVCGDCLGVNVQKYGRTSGLTKGTISGIIATVNIGYSSGTARFVDQIVVSGKKGGFIKSGDSGSLLVVDGGGDDLKPVGLLYAGSQGGKTALANRIDLVLDLLEDKLGPPSVTLTVDGTP
ncbi:MAG: hypothetical protein IH904_06935 [Proteobacteria bacterium]|nr:hypothetical protein [Pseudomonadota bacterium]